MSHGKFIVIEGTDGSGKATQHRLLVKRLKQSGQPLYEVDFPRYGQPSAELVELYLNNSFGDATKLDARLASALFAIDRQAAAGSITTALERGELVLANRFTASNMAHQGGKMATSEEHIAFFTWLHRLEHEVMGIPEPDKYLVLHVPAEIAQQRVLQKAKRGYTDARLDGHEADLKHLQRAEQTYLDLVETFPERFTVIECMDGKREKTIDEIQTEVWQRVRELLV